MLLSRIIIILTLIFVQDSAGVKENGNNDTTSTNGTSNDSNCDIYTNCSFHHKLTTLTSNGLINLTTNVRLLSHIPLIGLDNISVVGHGNPTINCGNAGGIFFENCHNFTIIGITWELCGTKNGSKPVIGLHNSSDIIIGNCTFKHSVSRALVFSELLGYITLKGCNFAFNSDFKGDGVAIYYLSKIEHHSIVHFTVSNCTFIHNGGSNGSVLYISPSNNKSIEQTFFTNLTFLNNQGKPIYISHHSVFVYGSILLTENNGGMFFTNNSDILFHESVVNFSHNKAQNGGALHIWYNSNVIFEGNCRVTFDNNKAECGGALFIDHNSCVRFEGNSTVTINSNQARKGGTLYITHNSNITFNGNPRVTINNNQAENGGAFFMHLNANIKFKGNSTVTFNNNQAKVSGALYIWQSSVTFTGNTKIKFINNTGRDGGVVFMHNKSKVTFKGNSLVTFDNNTARHNGGVLFILYSNITITENSEITFKNNKAYYDGGAITCLYNCTILFEGHSFVEFHGSIARDDGGVLYVLHNIDVVFKGDSKVIFNDNRAMGYGGAVYAGGNSKIMFQKNSTAKFNNNKANYFGGALYSKHHTSINFENNCTTTFTHNEASHGAAIFTVSDIVFKDNSTVKFANNKATTLGGAVYISTITFKEESILSSMKASLTIKQDSKITFTNNSADNGGAIFIYASTMLVSEHSNVVFTNNTAVQDGGAIYFSNQVNVTISSTLVLTYNIADNHGGAIYSKIIQSKIICFNNTNITFSNNTARVAGNILYIDVPKACKRSCLADRIVGFNNNALRCKLSDKEINTSPNTLKLHYPAKCITNNSTECVKYYINNIMLGQEIVLYPCLLDYYDKPAEVTQFKITGESHQNYKIHGSKHTSISCNHTIRGINIIGNKAISSLELNYSMLFILDTTAPSTFVRKIIAVKIMVGLSPCHPGFYYHSKSQKCECYNTSKILYCSGSHSAIKRGYWFGNVHGIPTVTFCPINYCNFTCCKITNGYYQLSPVRVNQCKSHRSGAACGSCEEGYTLSFDSPDCINVNKCNTGQTVLLVTLTVFYWFAIITAVFIIMYYQVGIGYFYAIMYYYSVVNILLSQHVDLSNGLYIIVTIISSIANLTPQFLGHICLLKDMSGTDQQFIHYVHPLAVSMILIIISWLARNSKRLSVFISRGIIRAICFLLLLSYTSVVTTSLLLLRSLTFVNVDNVYIYLSPDIQYFHGRHLAYGMIATFFTLLIVIGLPLLLLLEPFLNGKINFVRIKPLLDQFQGCYKDKYRWFAAYYMICRLIIISIIIANLSDIFISRYILITVSTAVALIHLIVRPYVDNVLNIFDGAILQLMVLVTVLQLFKNFDALNSRFIVGITFSLVISPLVLFTAMKLFTSKHILKQIIMKIKKPFSLQNEVPEELPAAVNFVAITNSISINFDDLTTTRRNTTVCEM